MQNRWEMSDSFRLALMLSFSGGLMDVYSYLVRGGVFANAQTGNILLFSIRLATGDFASITRYLIPVLAFSVGTALATILRLRYKNRPRVHWRQIVVLVEALLFICVAFIPQPLNLLANSLVSLACGAQVESFRKIRNTGLGIATTMCIGNLRSTVNALCEYKTVKDKRVLEKGFFSFAMIVGFASGAVCGNFLIGFLAEKTILASSLIMLSAFGIMLVRRET